MAEETSVIKCLVWDLDNTLWHGTLLEDGGAQLADDVRDVITTLDSRGILQAVASKNDHDLAWARLEELGVAQYFVVPKIGWGPKSESVRRIADELRFALDTIAFVDDQPAERAEVAYHLPQVRCYTHEQAPMLADLPEFDPGTITVDARNRRHMYQANFRRAAEQAEFTGPDADFLRSLEMVVEVARAGEEEFTRVEELTRRTSQMNATGVHYPDHALRRLLADPDHEVLVTTMTDRFGPHGAVGVLLLDRRPSVWHLKLLVTSCRVVSFGAGTVLLNWLVDQAHRAGVHLAADFRRTERNRMMEIAYQFAGFDSQSCGCHGDLPPAAAPDIQRLHLVPERRVPADTLRLIAPDLAAVDVH